MRLGLLSWGNCAARRLSFRVGGHRTNKIAVKETGPKGLSQARERERERAIEIDGVRATGCDSEREREREQPSSSRAHCYCCGWFEVGYEARVKLIS